MSKTLVIYYSRKGENYFSGQILPVSKGNTEYVAEYIRDAVGADLFEIVPVKGYSDNYKECCNEAYAELKAAARPELSRYLDSLGSYDNIVVCGPCWCGTYPMPMFTQVDRLDWASKKVFSVVTHEGSGFGSCEKDLKNACKGASFGKGLAVFGGRAKDSKAEVAEWARDNLV